MSFLSKTSLPLFTYFARVYPWQSLSVVLILLLAAFAETLGIGALLPLISIVLEPQNNPDASGNILQQTVYYLLTSMGLAPSLEVLLIMVVGMIIIKSAIVFLAMRYTGHVAADIARQFQTDLIHSLMRAEWPYFINISMGAVSNAIAAEAQRAGHSYMLAGRALAAFIQVFIYLGLAFAISWQLSVLALILGIVMIFSLKNFIRIVRKTGQDLSQSMNDLLAHLHQSLLGAKPLKAMGLEDRFCDQLDKQTAAVVVARKKQYEASLFLQIIYEPVIIICLALGLYYVLTFTYTPMASVILLALIFQRLMGYVSLAQSHYQNMLQNESAVWSMQRQIDAANRAKETWRGSTPPEFNHEIRLDHIHIAYKNGPTVFDDFSTIIPYQKLSVLFGPSGIGKTTLIDAILGLVPLEQGQITIDDQNLSDLDLCAWRSMTGYVPQDNFLFHDTIRWNVTLGDPAYTDNDVIQALTKAAALDFVMATRDGINTVVGERGGALSGGQRQRIILARALIRNPKLLILDEPTSALDKENEAAIFATLQALSNQMAIILISHNENVLNLTNHIIRLK